MSTRRFSGTASDRSPPDLPPGRGDSASASPARVTPLRSRPKGRLPRAILGSILTRIVGLAVLLAASGLLYYVASSPEFRISRVSVTGNRLLTSDEVKATAGMAGPNLFWVRRSELRQRLRLLPPVENADVSVELPDHLLIQVKEREPVAIWQVGQIPFLVDRDGLVLAARPVPRTLIVVHDTSGQELMPGSHVNADVVRNVTTVNDLLAQRFGPQQRQFEYAPRTGMNVVQTMGPRLILGTADDLEWKIEAIESIVRHLEGNHTSAELLDVRFRDRPYFR